MKRFTDTEKWRDPWFRALKPRLKCLWLYFCDTCDHAGVFQIDWELASCEVCERVSEKDLEAFGDRLQLLPSGRYLIKKYIKFQSGKLSEHCPAHKPILKLVELHGLVETSIGYAYPIARVSELLGYCYPMAYPTARVQEKEKRKETKDRGLGEGLELPEKLSKNEQFILSWNEWLEYRREKGDCKNFHRLFKKQLAWLASFEVPIAIDILENSLRNGYTGLFKPNSTNGNHFSNHKTVRGPSRTEGTYNANAKSLEHLVQRGLTGISDAERPSA